MLMDRVRGLCCMLALPATALLVSFANTAAASVAAAALATAAAALATATATAVAASFATSAATAGRHYSPERSLPTR